MENIDINLNAGTYDTAEVTSLAVQLGVTEGEAVLASSVRRTKSKVKVVVPASIIYRDDLLVEQINKHAMLELFRKLEAGQVAQSVDTVRTTLDTIARHLEREAAGLIPTKFNKYLLASNGEIIEFPQSVRVRAKVAAERFTEAEVFRIWTAFMDWLVAEIEQGVGLELTLAHMDEEGSFISFDDYDCWETETIQTLMRVLGNLADDAITESGLAERAKACADILTENLPLLRETYEKRVRIVDNGRRVLAV